ncbi:phage holin family protein [Globicatella sp. PHS-GS-PNBC-21-1553]|uniref:phage holin family protein n=1 Tax=Globicatella sp. PHS-GS-PNBC-21-1553 TaxID=2885764 RepID=UPI00298F3D57|nr:phage holin family protein [Globicatella sp. PHS-GS-PNBC-21-1553]WPC08127.1 phage holin family protein [Globicatella sp. PHS-GS-PNBC-21-1553]
MKNLLITTVVTIVMSYILPGVTVNSFMGALIFAIILGITNGIIGKILKTVGCLLTIISLGLFNLVVNGAMVLLADNFVSDVHIEGLFTAIILSIVISIFTTTENKMELDQR